MTNNVINTFYMMFKSNAKQAAAEIESYDKKIDALRTKGKARSEQESKELKDLQKQRKELNDHITETRNETEKLIETATQAVAAYVSFSAIKNGIIDAQKLNRELTIQTDLWGQNANNVAAYGAAVKAAGGSSGAAYSWYNNIRTGNASVGLPTMDFDKLMDKIHRQVIANPSQAQFLFGQYGITDPGQQKLLKESDSEYNKDIAQQKELTAQNAAARESSQQYGKALDSLDTALNNFWLTIGQQVLPTLTDFINDLTKMAKYLSENKYAADGFLAVALAVTAAMTKVLPRLLMGFLGIETGALAAASALIPFAASLAAVVAAAIAIPIGAKKGGAWIAHKINQGLGRGDMNGVLPGHDGYIGASSMSFWMSQGYSREQAAGLVANEMRESSGNAGARGDGGSAVGLFQWHPDRAAKILAGTGIDVRSAGRDDQLRAAAWELQNMGLDSKLKGIGGAGDAASFISRRYEIPAAADAEAMTRARMAMDIAGSSPFSSQNGTSTGGQTVNVENLTIHTQSSDPQSILAAARQAFKNATRESHAQFNDSVNY